MKKAQPSPIEAGRIYEVKAVVKALKILDALAEAEPPANTLTKLSRHLHLRVPTVHRLVATLLREGYIEAIPGARGYQLSFKVLRMGLGVLGRLDYRQVAKPFLEDLAVETEETVHLAILIETQAIVVGTYGEPQPDGVDVRMGDAAPLHSSSVGKALLAYHPRGLMTHIERTSGFRRFTPKTYTNLASLRQDLDRTREQGYALDLGETMEGIVGVGAPVFDHTGEVVAAFSVAGPEARLTVQRMPEITRLVCSARDQISHRLGYRGKKAGRRRGNRAIR